MGSRQVEGVVGRKPELKWKVEGLKTTVAWLILNQYAEWLKACNSA
jgi:hypothetical protein